MSDTPQSTGTSQYTGTVSLPNDGQIVNGNEPSTGSQGSPQPQSSTPPISSTPQATPTGAPQVNPGARGAQGQQTQGQQVPKSANLSKAPAGAGQPTGMPAPAAPPPAVQKAGVFHQVAEALAGGPRYKNNVDEYGNMQKEQVPVSNAHLAMAIALESLQGVLTGLSTRGPEAAERGGAAAFAQGKQQAQQQNQLQKQQASEDYQRRAQVAETNMRMYSMARQVGKMNEETTDAYIGQYHDLATKLQQDFPGYVQGPIKYSDFGKYNVTQDNAIPYSKVPRLDADGNQAVDNRGIPQWDINYLVVDPKLKASGLFDPDTIATLKKMGKLPASTGDMLVNTPTSLMMALNLKSQAAQYNVAQQTFGHFFDTVDGAGKGEAPSSYTPTNSPTLPAQISTLATTAAQKYGVSPQYIQGVFALESGGNPKAVSKTGAKGLGQLTDTTAKQMGVRDPFNSAQNADGTAKYFSQLLHQYNDPKLAAGAYYSGPGAIDKNGKIVDTAQHSAEDTQAYIDKFTNLVGLQTNKTQAPLVDKNAQAGTVQGQNNPETRLNMDQWTAKYPQSPADFAKFSSTLSQTEDNYGQAIAHMNTSGQQSAAANVSAFLGGPDAIALHDRTRAEAIQQHTLDAQAEKSEKLATDKAAQDQDAKQKKDVMLGTLESAQIPPDALKMDDKSLIANLQGQGVQLTPEDIRVAKAIARYDSPMNVGSNKLWFKDQSLNQQDLLDIVRTLNPSYDVASYDQIKSREMPNSPGVKTIQAASGIANHLNQLEKAAQEVANHGNGAGQFPALNAVKNWVNYQGGGTDYATLQALTNAVNGEIPKVLSGGFAPDKSQVDAVMKNMTPENSLQQIRALNGLYTKVMEGKVTPFDEEYNELSGASDKHLAIPHSLTSLFQTHGFDTPWATRNQQLAQQPQQPQQNVPAGSFAIRNQQKQIVGYKTATGQVTLFNQQQQQQQPQRQQPQGPPFLRPSTQPTPSEAQ